MSIRIQSEVTSGIAEAVSITGGWLLGWSGVLLILALV